MLREIIDHDATRSSRFIGAGMDAAHRSSGANAVRGFRVGVIRWGSSSSFE
jgi:hypothetical protein